MFLHACACIRYLGISKGEEEDVGGHYHILTPCLYGHSPTDLVALNVKQR